MQYTYIITFSNVRYSANIIEGIRMLPSKERKLEHKTRNHIKYDSDK